MAISMVEVLVQRASVALSRLCWVLIGQRPVLNVRDERVLASCCHAAGGPNGVSEQALTDASSSRPMLLKSDSRLYTPNQCMKDSLAELQFADWKNRACYSFATRPSGIQKPPRPSALFLQLCSSSSVHPTRTARWTKKMSEPSCLSCRVWACGWSLQGNAFSSSR